MRLKYLLLILIFARPLGWTYFQTRQTQIEFV